MPHSAKPRLGSVIGWAVVISLVIYGWAYLTVTTDSADDLFECKGIVKAVETKHEIPASLSAPGQPGIFCGKGVRFPFLTSYDTLFVYGVTGKDAQDSIINTLTGLHRDTHIRKLLVRFFERENLRTWSDGTGLRGVERGPETPIREIWIR